MLEKKSDSKLELHNACFRGHLARVEHLLKVKPKLLYHVDNDGDTVLHYSCFGFIFCFFFQLKGRFLNFSHLNIVNSNQPHVLEHLLMKARLNPNLVNANGVTALHVAVNKQYLKCVQVLVKYDCNPNIQVEAFCIFLARNRLF
jgi:ankyrin repeat protein